MPRTKGATPSSAKGVTGEPVASYKYSSKRKNIPPAGLEAQGVLHDAPKVRYQYNPHLPPALRSAPDAGQTDQLLDLLRNALLHARGQSAERKLIEEAGQRPLTPAELARLKTIFEAAITPAAAQYLADALRRHEPWLEWSGKREKPWFEVEPVALHIHERISTQAILRVLAREDVQRDLFADPQQSSRSRSSNVLTAISSKCSRANSTPRVMESRNHYPASERGRELILVGCWAHCPPGFS